MDSIIWQRAANLKAYVGMSDSRIYEVVLQEDKTWKLRIRIKGQGHEWVDHGSYSTPTYGMNFAEWEEENVNV